MNKIVIEDKVDWTKEDGGAAFVSFPMHEILNDEEDPDGDETTVGVRIISWDDKFWEGKRPEPKHDKFMQMAGKRVRITIELLED